MGILSNAFVAADVRQEQERAAGREAWPWTDDEVARTEVVNSEHGTVQLVLDGQVIAEFDREVTL